MKLPAILHTISELLSAQNAKAIVVGGSVRDHFLHLPVKDYDIEVYGLDTLERLQRILAPYGRVNLVGKSFGILKLTYGGEEYDFSFPRKESKVDRGHRGFEIEVDGFMDFKEAARRRDFTCNAMGYVIGTGELLDPFGGRQEMDAGILRHIESSTFIEDPLRVYRAVQFAARFGWTVAEETMHLCSQMVAEGVLEELPRERIHAEWQKLLLKAPRPSRGFVLMRELGIIERYFPELHALIDCPQDPQWHPEGDVWIHTMMTIDSMAKISDREEIKEKEKLKLMLATLCHDLGKPATTAKEFDEKLNRYRIRALGHEKAGLKLTMKLLERLTNEQKLIDAILPLVEHHLKPSQLYSQRAKPKAIKRLSTKVNIEELVLVAEADFLGRTTQEALLGEYLAGEWLLQTARELKVDNSPPKPLIQGRDLIRLGLKPSPDFKSILNHIYEKQIDGLFADKNRALEYTEKYIKDRYQLLH